MKKYKVHLWTWRDAESNINDEAQYGWEVSTISFAGENVLVVMHKGVPGRPRKREEDG